MQRPVLWGPLLASLVVVVLWYSTNAAFAVFAKVALSASSLPAQRAFDLTFVQLAVGAVAGAAYAVAAGCVTRDALMRGRQVLSTSGARTVAAQVSGLHLLGGLLTNVGYAHGSAATTQVRFCPA
jgi:hypothetical protein